jgi:hypothetical protein
VLTAKSGLGEQGEPRSEGELLRLTGGCELGELTRNGELTEEGELGKLMSEGVLASTGELTGRYELGGETREFGPERAVDRAHELAILDGQGVDCARSARCR